MFQWKNHIWNCVGCTENLGWSVSSSEVSEIINRELLVLLHNHTLPLSSTTVIWHGVFVISLDMDAYYAFIFTVVGPVHPELSLTAERVILNPIKLLALHNPVQIQVPLNKNFQYWKAQMTMITVFMENVTHISRLGLHLCWFQMSVTGLSLAWVEDKSDHWMTYLK